LVIGFSEHLQNVTTNNYGNLTELHNPKITVTTAHIKPSQSLLTIAWLRLPTGDVSLPLASRTAHGLKVKATLRLTVYRHSVRVDVKHLETHDQRFIFSTEALL
jgi:hypothetical protein